MINIVTSFYPYRMNISAKEPVELSVTIKNVSKLIKLLSFEVILEQTLSFDKSGLKKSESFRLGDVKPNESRTHTFKVNPFQGIKPGSHRVKLIVNEHYRDYDSLTDKTEKIIEIKAI